MNFWHPAWLSLQVTFVATVAILLLGMALALLLARTQIRGKLLIETVITLPLVLPPSVVGYFLLILLGRNSVFFTWLGWDILFTWQAAAIAATVVGLPLMVQASRAALEEADEEAESAARVDGASEWQIWRYVTIPLARRGILAGLILASARALGEFGATLMVAGSIPGRTQTLPLAIYDAVQARRYDDAHFMVLVMTSIAFAALWIVYRLTGLYTNRQAPRTTSQRIRKAANENRNFFR
jgi:molybdate transport system permease protein